jgi:hypothetical protein
MLTHAVAKIKLVLTFILAITLQFMRLSESIDWIHTPNYSQNIHSISLACSGACNSAALSPP